MVKICICFALKFSRAIGAAVVMTMTILTLAASAMPIPAKVSKCGTATINSVENSAIMTAAGRNQIQLASIKMPELWPQGAAYANWRHAAWAHDQLEGHVRGKAVELFCEGETISYDDKKIAQILLPTGEWLQWLLVKQGAAFVFPRRDHLSGLEQLYAAEDDARDNGLGIWQTTKILTADSLATNEGIRTGWFQVIRGTVLNAARVRSQIFLNFGTDWRQDFTAEIPSNAMRAFRKADMDPMTLQSKYVEVRGWVTWKGGPHIMLEGPGQIRLINP